ncbi:MAG: NADH:ubiquinone reductase (Na(+)-transporting) subunit E [Candidatus Omnitrophica bacterium]|nr:NADH:ubiquinone reductase (Na(+)-transporting) subunit E [Candidatus Omnitrophota bacterium]
MITHLLIIFCASILTNNIALTYFLGMCPFIAISKDLRTAFGMGIAVTFVMTLTATINWCLYEYILVPNGVEYLAYVTFILVIAALVQIVEMIIERFSSFLYVSMGIFLPLITVNCAILGVSLFMVIRNYSFFEVVAYSLGSGLGWMLAILAMAGIRSKLRFADVPRGLEGAGITLIIAGIMALGFMGFAGIISLQ